MLNKNFMSTFVDNERDELDELVSRFKDVNDVPGIMYIDEHNKNIRIVRGKHNHRNCIALIRHTNDKYGHLNEVEICWSSKSAEGEAYELNNVYGGNKRVDLTYVFSHMCDVEQPTDDYVPVGNGKFSRNTVFDLELSPDGVLYDCKNNPKDQGINRKNYENDSRKFRRIISKSVFLKRKGAYFLTHPKVFVHKICGAAIMGMTFDDFTAFRNEHSLDIDHIDSDSGSSCHSNRFTNLQLVTKRANQDLKICRGDFRILYVLNF